LTWLHFGQPFGGSWGVLVAALVTSIPSFGFHASCSSWTFSAYAASLAERSANVAFHVGSRWAEAIVKALELAGYEIKSRR